MLVTSEFRRSPDLDGTPLKEWFLDLPSGVEVLVSGDDHGPSPQAIQLADFVVANIDLLKGKAVHLLESFMKDGGSWELLFVDVSHSAAMQECPFLLRFHFEADRDPHEYRYTYFEVCFALVELPKADRRARPVKFVVGFH